MVKELERRQKIKRAVYSWPALAVVAIITILLIKGAFGIMKIERQSAARVKELENEASALAAHEGELEAQIERLKTPEGVVEEIKDKFSAVREGEYVAIIVDERVKASSTEENQDNWAKRAWLGFKNLWGE
jgi:cell division protein FtsB